jgi:3-deoxy-D-manno-octulosonate 8-phosphate phosphatase (KDO 8-P phosphatase)
VPVKTRASLAARARKIRLVLFDVDGVLTDGGLFYGPNGVEWKRFHAQDGYGIRRAQEAGLHVGIVSGRVADAVTARARDLGITECHQGIEHKLEVLPDLRRRLGCEAAEVAYMGDDLFDMPLLRAVGLSAAPADARPEVRRMAGVVTRARGGNGAAREFLELLLGHRRAAAVGERRAVPRRDGRARRTSSHRQAGGGNA